MLARALLLVSAAVAAVRVTAATAYDVKNVVRTIELGGGVSSISMAYTLAPPPDHLDEPFHAAFAHDEWHALSSFELSVVSPKSMRGRPLAYADAGADATDNSTHLLAIDLSPFPVSDEDIAFTFTGTFNHLTFPLPPSAPQNADQFLAWKGDTGIRSAYPVRKGRTKVSVVGSTNIPDYSPRETATKLGNKVTYGPYTSIPSFRDAAVEQGLVRFEFPLPVLSVVSVERVAEVSHWAGNLAIEDRAWVRNDGPKLDGHFGRIDYQAASFRGQRSPTTLIQMRIPLPPGAKDAYVVDAIGNVSTSRFAPVPPNPDLITRPIQMLNPSQASVLDLQPRYPLLGGWNYTFSYGFNLDMSFGGWGKVLDAGKFSVAVPFLTPISGGSAYDDVTLKIVLPEGADDVEVFVPFAVDSQEAVVTKTYLDSTGRKTVVLKKKNCTDKNSQLVYVHYTLSSFATLQKPLAVASLTMGILLVAALLRRFDLRIKTPKRKAV